MNMNRAVPFVPFEKAKKILSGYAEIELAYLFGSAARGGLQRESDIDIGILLQRDFDAESAFSLRLELMNQLQKIFERATEVVILNKAPLLLQYEAIKYHKPIYVKDERVRLSYESKVRRMYFDFRLILKRHSKNFLERLLKGGLLGAIRRSK